MTHNGWYTIKPNQTKPIYHVHLSLHTQNFTLSVKFMIYWLQRIWKPPKRCALGITLNCIWWRGSNSENLVCMECLFNVIILRSTQSRNGCIFYYSVKWICLSIIRMWMNRVKKIFWNNCRKDIRIYTDSLTSAHKIIQDELTCH